MRKRLPLFLALAGAVLLTSAQAGRAAGESGALKLDPERIETFFIQPGVAQQLTWKTAAPEGLLPYSLQDYAGNTLSEGMGTVGADGRLVLSLQLPRGYYEVVIQDQHFGVIAQDAFTRPADPYFGVDAVLTWLERRAPMRESLVKALKRSGISWSRERMRWVGVNPKPGVWDWSEYDHTWDLRQKYAAEKMTVLEMFHDGGSAKGQWPFTCSFPMNLPQMAASWPTIYNKFSATWGGLEVWNEPDGGYGYGLPADQYVPLVKTMRWAFQQAKITQPIGSGVFIGTDPSTYHQYCNLNGMLDHSDFVSFHDYRRATEMERLVKVYRDWLRESGKESMPLWLTEAGWPWDKGPGRPPLDQDQVSAMEIAWKGVEAKACGVAHYMPFCLAFYEEGGIKSFSMMGKEVTPLRSMGAYVQSVRALAGLDYAGDLDVAGAIKTRVFADPANAAQRVAVIFTNDIGTKNITLPASATRAETMDGRALTISNNSIQVSGGMAYVWFDAAAVDAKLHRNTLAAELLAASRKPAPVAAPASPVVLRYVVDPTQESPSMAKYLLSQDTAAHWRVKVNAYNLSDQPEQVTLQIQQRTTGAALGSPQRVEIPARGVADANWTLDVRGAVDVAHVTPIAITGQRANGQAISAAVLPVLLEGSMEQFESKFRMQPIPFIKPAEWQRNMVGHGHITMTAEGSSLLRMAVNFDKPGERWVYPKLPIQTGLLAGKKGLLIRARTQETAAVRIILFEKVGGAYWTNSTIIPTDGQWHVAYIPFDEFETLPSHPDKVDFKLDLDQVNFIAVGMHDNSKDHKNTLEISDLRVVGTEGTK